MHSQLEASGHKVLVDEADLPALMQYRWHVGSSGYASRSYMRESKTYNVLMHRLIMGEPIGQVDHINRNRLDNRRCNLRIVTCGTNRQNSDGKMGISGFRGVCFNKGRYRVMIACSKQRFYLGQFDDVNEAARAYDAKALELYGPHARLNFPEK